MIRGLARLSVALAFFGLISCGGQAEKIETSGLLDQTSETGIRPNIVPGNVTSEEKPILIDWIDETVTLFQSSEFETNFLLASELFPRVYVSKSQDIIHSTNLLNRLKTNDPMRAALWWPKTYVVLNGPPAIRSKDRNGFGFEGSRKAAAGPRTSQTGEIVFGRLHFARYASGDVVEKSCAINSMAHEISHTLSDRRDEYWMHILDSEENVTPPRGVFEASYFIGVVAQCTYLQNEGRISQTDFPSCLLTFSDPETGSRFKSLACDDFPNAAPIRPSGRIIP